MYKTQRCRKQIGIKISNRNKNGKYESKTNRNQKHIVIKMNKKKIKKEI
jgi:hypothetical protein